MEYTKWVVKQEKFKLTYKCILYYTKILKSVLNVQYIVPINVTYKLLIV